MGRGMGLVDEVIEEPAGGAHVNHDALFKRVDKLLSRQLQDLAKLDRKQLVEERYRRFRDMGREGREFKQATP
jgi:acetyl-CoA carboxylase carboxyl transferase subunit alpha